MSIIDFHSHILPYIDDGSKSVEQSIQMLKAEKEAGIKTVALTPHFYADYDSPDHFLQKRAESKKLLDEQMTDDLPELLLGSEVAYFEGMRNCEELKAFRIEKTRLILIEMPIRGWNERMLKEVLMLSEKIHAIPMIAHLDRYKLTKDDIELMHDFVDSGGLVQVNASAFSNFFLRNKMLRYLEEKTVHLLGSDCHNMTTRAPNLKDALSIIEEKNGHHAIERIEKFQNSVFKF